MNALPALADVQLGPAMEALPNDKQRAFVIALFDAPKAKGRQLWAARAAGYGSDASSSKSIGVIASRLVSDPRIQAAIAEESHKRLRAVAPSAVVALGRLVDNPFAKDHARGIAMILERSDAVQTNVQVRHEHAHEHKISVADVDKTRKRIIELAARAGVPTPEPKLIEGEFQIVGGAPQ